MRFNSQQSKSWCFLQHQKGLFFSVAMLALAWHAQMNLGCSSRQQHAASGLWIPQTLRIGKLLTALEDHQSAVACELSEGPPPRLGTVQGCLPGTVQGCLPTNRFQLTTAKRETGGAMKLLREVSVKKNKINGTSGRTNSSCIAQQPASSDAARRCHVSQHLVRQDPTRDRTHDNVDANVVSPQQVGGQHSAICAQAPNLWPEP